MTVTDTTPTTEVPPIDHREAMVLAEEAYRRLADLVEGLGPDDWDRATDCEGWTVRDLVRHLVGALRSAASVREMASQQLEVKRRVKRTGQPMTDVMTALQIERAAALSDAELTAELRALVGPATAGRRRTPAPLRRWPKVPVEVGSINEGWSLGYLVDVILTRDAWLHRVDLSRAVGAELVLTPEHDGRIVADVAAEWARRHGQACTLVLTGPAGGTFRFPGTGAGAGAGEGDIPTLELDAVEFCRILSCRAPGDGLLATEVPF